MNAHTAGALFAGGNSRRMGRDKARVQREGRAFWEIQCETLRLLGLKERFVVAPQSPPWVPRDFLWIPDHPEYAECGPLAGFAGLARHLRSPQCLVLGIDLPALDPAYLSSLLHAFPETSSGWIPRLDDRIQPFAACYPRSVLMEAIASLNGGNRRVQTWVEQAVNAGMLQTVKVPPSRKNEFANVNTPEELKALNDCHENPS